jgi:hypothetical protein
MPRLEGPQGVLDLKLYEAAAGDIGNPYRSNYDVFMKYISEKFKQTFVSPGNHEYDNKTKTIQETNNHLK